MPKQPIADQFSDDEMEQMKRYGQASTPDHGLDSDAIEKELNRLQAKREANAGKMQAAQTGGGSDPSLGPSQIDQATVKQRGAIDKSADDQSDTKAAQAQAQQAPISAPAAPTGSAGTTTTFPAQKGAVGGGGNAQQPGQTPPPQAPPPAPGGPPGEPPPDEEEGPPQ